jgi:hypothetical protein
MTPDEHHHVIDELQAVIDETQQTIERFEATGMDDERGLSREVYGRNGLR